MVYTGNRHANKIGAVGDVAGGCVPYAEEVPQWQGRGESPSGAQDMHMGLATEKKKRCFECTDVGPT